MTRYQLQARRIVVVPPGRVLSDETRLVDGDDQPALMADAHALADRGFTVWLFECGHGLGGCLRMDQVAVVEPVRPGRASDAG